MGLERMFGTLLSLGWLGCNVAPTAPVITLEPGLPTTGDDLELVFQEEALDPNGDGLEYRIAWFQDDSERADLSDEQVDASETTRGETWEVQVRAWDGVLEGPVMTASVVILNSGPIVTELEISPAEPLAGDELVATYSVEDADGDALSSTVLWSVDGLETWHESATLPAHATRRGEEWSIQVVAEDGFADSDPEVARITIGNTAPPAPSSVEIAPSAPTTADTLLCVVDGATEDTDEDPIAWTVQWLVDATLHGTPQTTTWEGDTVDPSDTQVDQVWSCAATSSDGELESAARASQPVTIGEETTEGSR
jgi:hypothetical protein